MIRKGREVVPRVSVAGGVIGLILVKTTMPQVVKTSDGLQLGLYMPTLALF